MIASKYVMLVSYGSKVFSWLGVRVLAPYVDCIVEEVQIMWEYVTKERILAILSTYETAT